MCPSDYGVSGHPRPRRGRGGVQTRTKTSLGCASKILLRLVQGVGFPLALHMPPDKERNIHLYAHYYIYLEDGRKAI